MSTAGKYSAVQFGPRVGEPTEHLGTGMTGVRRRHSQACGSDWNQIGEIEDVVLDRSGQTVGVTVEVGGFLDIGDKHVLLRVGDVDLVPVDDRSYSLITRYSEEELEEMPGVDESWME